MNIGVHLFTCLACAGHLQQACSSNELLQRSSLLGRHQALNRIADECAQRGGPLQALSALFLSLNPEAAFNPSVQMRGTPRSNLNGIASRSKVPLMEATTLAEEDADTVAVDFPAPLNAGERAVRALTFYSRVLPVLFRYKVEEVKLQIQDALGQDMSLDNQKELWAEIDEWGSDRIYETIADLKGFYVKTGQVISTRVDLFPEAYTNKLKNLQDGLDAMPAELVRAVVEQELLGGQPLSELFLDFEDEPLGSASIAQVHKATLLDGRTVAVKVQRPNIEPKLLGDISNLKRISKALRKQLPVDYYTVFCELGRVLDDELNFLQEAQALRKIHAAVGHGLDGKLGNPPVFVPLPVGDLVSRRVLVMEFVEGSPLNRLQERLKERNIDPNSAEAKLAGIKILDSLSVAFERMIFGSGFLHGDPHPGNIFVQEGAKVALIDCGQVKFIPRKQRLRLAETIVQVADYQKLRRDPNAKEAKVTEAMRSLADKVRLFGVQLTELEEGQDPDELAAAVALLLFGDKDMELPGGYSTNELDEKSPIRLVASFPQELVLLGRATVLLKGISKRLKVPFSLADTWANGCRQTIASAKKPNMPLWGKQEDVQSATAVAPAEAASSTQRIKMRNIIKPWYDGKVKSVGSKVFNLMPKKLQGKLRSYAAKKMLEKRLGTNVTTTNS